MNNNWNNWTYGSGYSQMTDVADIATRDAGTWVDKQLVRVLDATADTSVNANWAIYQWDADGEIWTKISEGESIDVVRQTTTTITTSGWSLVSGVYEKSISVGGIESYHIVTVVPDNADYQTVLDAQFLPRTESSTGAVKVFAVNVPAANIGVTLTILTT